jgi:hypothetical protein
MDQSGQGDNPAPTPPRAPPIVPNSIPTSLPDAARCHMCGYILRGLPAAGVCPECGQVYTYESATRLKPWPSAAAICVRLGWPFLGLLAAGIMIALGDATGGASAVVGMALTWAIIVALIINSYFQVRWMLKRSLPHTARTRGSIATMRYIGTTICVLLLLAFVGVPLALGITCLVLLSQGGF